MCDDEGRWQVLEDNLRTTSGIAHVQAVVAQRTIMISTHPTFTGTEPAPRVVDQRAFVVLGPEPKVLPTP